MFAFAIARSSLFKTFTDSLELVISRRVRFLSMSFSQEKKMRKVKRMIDNNLVFILR